MMFVVPTARYTRFPWWNYNTKFNDMIFPHAGEKCLAKQHPVKLITLTNELLWRPNMKNEAHKLTHKLIWLHGHVWGGMASGNNCHLVVNVHHFSGGSGRLGHMYCTMPISSWNGNAAFIPAVGLAWQRAFGWCRTAALSHWKFLHLLPPNLENRKNMKKQHHDRLLNMFESQVRKWSQVFFSGWLWLCSIA